MYTVINFRTKKQLKERVAAYNRNVTLRKMDFKVEAIPPVTLFAPGIGKPNDNGTEFVEGPHYPEPHKWYAQVTVENGIVVRVK